MREEERGMVVFFCMNEGHTKPSWDGASDRKKERKGQRERETDIQKRYGQTGGI